MKTAVFPGTFDPFTLGHESIVRKALPLFDQIIVAIGTNSTKTALFDIEQRSNWIRKTFEGEAKIKVDNFQGLTVDYCIENEAQYLLRGLRNPQDFQYESSIAQMNHALRPEVSSVFFICDPAFAAINSSIVREIYKSGGDVAQFLPQAIDLS